MSENDGSLDASDQVQDQNGKRRRKKDRWISDRSAETIFLLVTATLVAFYQWPRRWLLSGAPALSLTLLHGNVTGYRVLPGVPLWPILTSLNLLYAVAATSWLLFWAFLVLCYPVILVTSLFQFDGIASLLRRRLRSLLKHLHFTHDKVALFNLPALEIDTEVDGLMVIRGLTVSLSSLTIVAHGIEVGIKLTDDMELAIQAEQVVVKLFRHIQISDVYANLKGGQHEMTFGTLAKSSRTDEGDALMQCDAEIIRVAAAAREHMVKMTDEMTQGASPKDASLQEGISDVTRMSVDEAHAHERYEKTLAEIRYDCSIATSRHRIKQIVDREERLDLSHNDTLAAICSHLHRQPSIGHPPRKSIRVTTLDNLLPLRLRRVLRRMPMLLRLLLNPLSYFHTISVDSITAAASGAWVQSVLEEKIFAQYRAESVEIRRLESRVLAWLAEANFALQLVDIAAYARVPFLKGFKIENYLAADHVMAYRTLPKETEMKQIIQLGGADAAIKLPAYLLPHHEHLLPPRQTRKEEKVKEQKVDDAPGKPKTVQAQYDLDQSRKDVTQMDISVHLRLPACLDQEMLDFLAALIKASKLVDMERHFADDEDETHGFAHFAKQVRSKMKHDVKRVAVDAVANDRWIAKLVGKITSKLETAQGEVGYSGNVPIALQPYRDNAEDAVKLLP